MLRLSFLFVSMALFIASAAFSLTVTNPFKQGSTLVNIGGNVKTLTRSTSCKAKYWGNVQENACACCIIKSALRAGGQFKSKGNHITHCLQKKHCTEASINNIATTLNVSYDANNQEAFVTQIINNSQVVSKVGSIGKEYHVQGKINTQGIVEALSILAEQGKIKHSAQSIKTCFNVEELSDKGSQTIQTFLVSQNTDCDRKGSPKYKSFNGLYIVKELGKGTKEIKNTTKVKESFLGKYNLTNTNRPIGFPAIALDEISFNYKDHKGKTHYLAILNLAPGQSVFKILKNFAEASKNKDQSSNSENSEKTFQKARIQVRHAMASLGAQIGRLHATYMTKDKNGRLTGKSTAVHGDMHSNNIFLENSTLGVTFIDGETFVIGLKSPRYVGKDLLRIYLFSTIRNAPHQNARKGNVDQTSWHKEVIEPFLREYILAYAYIDGSYNKDNFEDVLRILRSSFSLSGSKTDPEAVFIRTGVISSLRSYQKYIRPLIKEIEEKIRNHPNPIEFSLQTQFKTQNRNNNLNNGRKYF